MMMPVRGGITIIVCLLSGGVVGGGGRTINNSPSLRGQARRSLVWKTGVGQLRGWAERG